MKEIVSITELVKMGYPEKAVREAVHSIYAKRFAVRTSPRGKFYINLEKFRAWWERDAK